MTAAGVEAPQRLRSLDALRAVLVTWIIAGHALLGYSAIGGWAYDEVSEVTFSPACSGHRSDSVVPYGHVLPGRGAVHARVAGPQGP